MKFRKGLVLFFILISLADIYSSDDFLIVNNDIGSGVSSVAYSQHNAVYVLSTEVGEIRIYNEKNNELIRKININSKIKSVEFTADDDVLVVRNDYTLQLRSKSGLNLDKEFFRDEKLFLLDSGVSFDGKSICVISRTRNCIFPEFFLHIIDVESKKIRNYFNLSYLSISSMKNVIILPDNTILITYKGLLDYEFKYEKIDALKVNEIIETDQENALKSLVLKELDKRNSFTDVSISPDYSKIIFRNDNGDFDIFSYNDAGYQSSNLSDFQGDMFFDEIFAAGNTSFTAVNNFVNTTVFDYNGKSSSLNNNFRTAEIKEIESDGNTVSFVGCEGISGVFKNCENITLRKKDNSHLIDYFSAFNENLIFYLEYDGKIKCCNLNDNTCIYEIANGFKYHKIFSFDGSSRLYALVEGAIHAFDMKTGTLEMQKELHFKYIADAVYSKNKNILVTAGRDKWIKYWDADTFDLKNIVFYSGYPVKISISEDNSKVAVAGWDKLVAAESTCRISVFEFNNRFPLFEKNIKINNRALYNRYMRNQWNLIFTENGDEVELSSAEDNNITIDISDKKVYNSKIQNIIPSGYLNNGEIVYGLDSSSNIRLLNLKTGQSLKILIFENSEWIVIGNNNSYDCSAGAESILVKTTVLKDSKSIYSTKKNNLLMEFLNTGNNY
jgi:hypothetical protein